MKKFTALLAAAAFTLATSARAADPATSLSEGFDDINQLPGWSLLNNSLPPGAQNWFQGNTGIFAAQSGAADSYIAANFLGAANDSATLAMILLTPTLHLAGPTSLSFWARSAAPPGFSDALDVLVGSGTDLSTYTVLQSIGAVPADWTLFEPALNASGDLRLAFRYQGPAGQSAYLGIDSVALMPVPEPATCVMLCIGLIAMLGYRHKRALVAYGAIAISSAAFAGTPPEPQPGMIAVKDPQTGQLRPPTPAEARALATAAAALAPAAAPVTVRRPDGTFQRHLGDAGMTYSVLSRTADGKLAIDCVTGAKAADDALKQEGAGDYSH
jgi:hypothetical protein